MRYARAGAADFAMIRIAAGCAFVLLALSPLRVSAADVDESGAVALMRDHKCYICHSDEQPFAGPSFADVAAGYRGMPNAAAVIERFIVRGEHGNGPWHMPPHPELSAADARAMARYIMSLDKPPPAPGPPGTPTGGRDQPDTPTSPRS